MRPVAKNIRRLARRFWRGVREWCGDSAYERYLRAGVDQQTARLLIGHKSSQTSDRYNVQSWGRAVAGIEQLIAGSDPRNTRASEGRGEAGSPS